MILVICVSVSAHIDRVLIDVIEYMLLNLLNSCFAIFKIHLIHLDDFIPCFSFCSALGRRVVYAVRMPTKTQQAKAILTAGAVTAGKLFSSFFQQ